MRVILRRILFRNVTNAVSLIGLALIAAAISVYILDQQRLRFPYFEDAPWRLNFEFSTAQAVVPGQGQTLRVSGIRVGDIAEVELVNGRGIVRVDVDQEYRKLIYPDAKALLRPKTGLKDMFIELDPGRRGKPVPEDFTVPVRNTLPDVNTEETLAMLDSDTRSYLKVLLNDLDRGLKGRGDELGEVFRRLEPTTRDLRRISTAVAARERNVRRVVNHMARLNTEVARADEDLTRLVRSASTVFRAYASEEDDLGNTVQRFPAALRETTTALGKLRSFANVARPAADRIRPSLRALDRSNPTVRESAREVTPPIRDAIRPFVREVQPLVRDSRGPAARLADATPDLTKLTSELNTAANTAAFNPGGREDPAKPGREEGYLFHFGWLGHVGPNLHSNADAHGTFRPVAFASACNTIKQTLEDAPEQEFLQNLTPIITSSAACGSVEFPEPRPPDLMAPVRRKAERERAAAARRAKGD